VVVEERYLPPCPGTSRYAGKPIIARRTTPNKIYILTSD